MKRSMSIFFAGFVSVLSAQNYNFHDTEYYVSPTASSAPGTVLTGSGTNLSGFSFDTAPTTHAMYTTGVYFPVVDCGGRNLWVRVEHIAHDPNGAGNGYNINQTNGSPFQPPGSTDRIGGWTGFLYEMTIIADQSLTGVRSNILDAPYPTSITVSSLETLYNNGSGLHEWLSFEIFDPGSTGWELNSINFTGINPFSMPGFSADLNYSTTATSTTPPTGFSTEFPSGSLAVYAVDMNLSNEEHSEFSMTAGGVSRFRYGYEYTVGGYQGMGISFGSGPVLNVVAVDPVCSGDANGSISVSASGQGPFNYLWSSGGNGPVEANLIAGEYVVSVTDVNGCLVQETIAIDDPPLFSGSIVQDNGSGTVLLVAEVTGGVDPYTFAWSDGWTGSATEPLDPGPYSVMVTDASGCQLELQFVYVGITELDRTVVRIYPNPSNGQFILQGGPSGGELLLYDTTGRCVFQRRIGRGEVSNVDGITLTPGIYVCKYQGHDQVIVLEPR